MKLKSKFGYSLVESMITLGLSSFILIGATQIFITTQRINQKVITDRINRTNNQLVKDELEKIFKNAIFFYQYVDLSTSDPARPIPQQANPLTGNMENIPVVFTTPDNSRNKSTDVTSLDLPYIKTVSSPNESKPGNVLMFITSELKPFADVMKDNPNPRLTTIDNTTNNNITGALDNIKNYYDNPSTNTLTISDLTLNQKNEISKAKVVILTLNVLYLRDMVNGFDNEIDKNLNSGAKELVLYQYSNLYKLQPDPVDPNKKVVQAYMEGLKGNLGEASTSSEWSKYDISQSNVSSMSRMYEAKVLEYLTYALTATGYKGWGENYVSNVYDVTGVYHGGKSSINPFENPVVIRTQNVQNAIPLPTSGVTSTVHPSTTKVLARYITSPTSSDDTKLFSFERKDSSPVNYPDGVTSGGYSAKDYDIRDIKVRLNIKKILPNGQSNKNDNIFLVELPKLPKS